MLKVLIMFTLLSLMLSCGRIRWKGREVVEEGKQKIAHGKVVVLDKVWPQFDAGTADTRNNKKRFHEFMHFDAGPDVMDLYCWDDRIGINSSFFFGFRCQDTTIKRVINVLHLQPYRGQIDSLTGEWSGSLFQCRMPWWDSAAIQRIIPYVNKEDRLYWYLWYDTKREMAYFETFDM